MINKCEQCNNITEVEKVICKKDNYEGILELCDNCIQSFRIDGYSVVEERLE